MSSRNPTAEELPELIAMVSAAFGYSPPRTWAEDFPLFFAQENREHLYIKEGADGKRIAAHAGAFLSVLKSDGQRFSVGGIGGVCTRPEYRGRGFARELVRASAEDLRSRGALLAFLWTDQHDFYRQEGFELVGRQWGILLPPERLSDLEALSASRVPPGGLQISRGMKPEQVNGAYLLFCRHQLGLERTRAQFTTLLQIPGAELYTAECAGRVSAYIVIGKGVDLADCIHEWAGDEGALLALAARALADRGRLLQLLAPQFTPEESPWLYALDSSGFKMQAGSMAMVKLLAPAQLEEILRLRTEALGLDATKLVFRYSEEKCALGWGEETVECNRLDFIRLLFGPEAPSELLGGTKPIPELDAVFPLRLWWWGLDSV